MVPTRRSFKAVLLVVVAALLGASPAATAQTSGPTTIFQPTAAAGYANPGAMYARAITLHHNGEANGTLFSTFEVYRSAGAPAFPVYRSGDAGKSWTYVSQVTDTVNGYGMRWNPEIYELPDRLGTLPAGTLLVSGLSVPADMHSTEILLYASTDLGKTWKLLSSVAKGGVASVSDPNTPIWEPVLLMRNGKLIVYYSDQRDNAHHSQKLVHQVTTDGRTWGPVVDDVAYPAQRARPGMATVAELPGGRWIMTYEYCNAPQGSCPVYYKIATDPEKFGQADDNQIVLDNGAKPCCQPFVVWTPSGGPQGTIVVSNGGGTDLAVNTAGGDPTQWRSQASNAPGGYSRGLMVMPDGNTVMSITGGWHDSTYLNTVEFALDHVAPGLSTGATYTLTNDHSRLNLGVNGSSVVQQSAATPWVITRQPTGYFTVATGGRVLSVVGGSTLDGAWLELRTPSPGSATQEWAVVQQPDGTYELANRKSGKLLEDLAWATTPGAPMAQWSDADGRNQRWTLHQTALPNLTTGDFTIQNKLGKYLEIAAGSTAPGTQADQWWYANQPWHLWRFTTANGGYRIVNAKSGLALTDTHPAAGEAITQTAVDPGNAQQVWTLVPSGDQTLIKNAGSGRYITIAGGSPSNLAKAVSWTKIETPDQFWTVRRIN
ncbi:Ricin-type beta-trefoil lectin domain-like [Amycolatopsis tolypomycina]|uniref:Ricin-type beta-trefoil lectin domain-like n=1 Tax=Amycolatopsis tolypomycina TaxID=208445 RepID=A0A1H4SRY5_9PSEU|nr:RICIN domain-containing protein [Amycolatopsis tolypomycina]SEC46744.1 Ricin-type beta-trefoil lectin domain-like [Amycolatopsis tolypomycina]